MFGARPRPQFLRPSWSHRRRRRRDTCPGRSSSSSVPGRRSPQQTAALADAGAVDTRGRVAGVGAKLVRVTGDAKAAAARLSASAAVEYAEVDKILTAYAASVPERSASSPEQYALDLIDAPRAGAPRASAAFPSTGGTKVGIVDTGIDRSHPEFAGRISNCAQSTAFFGLERRDPLGLRRRRTATAPRWRASSARGRTTASASPVSHSTLRSRSAARSRTVSGAARPRTS